MAKFQALFLILVACTVMFRVEGSALYRRFFDEPLMDDALDRYEVTRRDCVDAYPYYVCNQFKDWCFNPSYFTHNPSHYKAFVNGCRRTCHEC